MSYYSSEVLASLSTLTLYRVLIKNMKYYPSKKRFEVLLSIKEEFRENRKLTDEKAIFIEKKKARLGVAHVMMFNEKMKELRENYKIQDSPFVESLNPKDKDFIYF